MKHTAILLLSLLSYHLTSQTDPDFDNRETIDDGYGCDAGQVVRDDMCELCPEGTYADKTIQQCRPCPLDTFSSEEGSSECTPCPGRYQTTYTNSFSIADCKDVCHIPETVNAWYEAQTTGVLLETGDRVSAGQQLVLRCKDRDHNVLKTEYSFLIITCTATFNTVPLPNMCYSTLDSETEATNGLICYDSCYKETNEGRSRFTQSVGGGTQVVDSCPMNECKGDENVCATVSYKDTFRSIDRIHYTCAKSSAFNHELCSASGATNEELADCKVTTCDTNKCNKPGGSESGAQHVAASVAMVMGVMLWHVIIHT